MTVTATPRFSHKRDFDLNLAYHCQEGQVQQVYLVLPGDDHIPSEQNQRRERSQLDWYFVVRFLLKFCKIKPIFVKTC
ncbi:MULTISPECIES: hypothetical protein [Cyanophyceae]|uniref:hypothetical protein n=1 Tax=Cyanophyceae TaxID=3028117 RepID=UPI00232D1D38|nr:MULTISPECIES: hypothetical protein [Cyanophyceae]MDB9357163.1 hypothetical protein [Nodularia spumigena CS-587/03]MDB9303073.1 hypothetical protein [Nodularia spumigena CS-591/12]MDB9316748.1 hypothetical protein [Nodularia spumigena CS-590/01A]MDB9320485.1 hypothetical protein [Nodularia spumigena CS-591/07A]MDB9325602.1 hypothetical protein [Nodularia spumigena CS-590/02]